MYVNLASRPFSNHCIFAYVDSEDRLGLSEEELVTYLFNQRSWKAESWFRRSESNYLRHNLYEDGVATATLILLADVLAALREISVRIERLNESLFVATLSHSYFE